MSKPVFISYSTDDTAVAEKIRDGLESGDRSVAGIPCWMAPRDIAPGLEYGSQIVAAIEECAVLVLLLSESSNRSRFVLNEVERAVSKDKIVIPVRIHDVAPSRSLEFFISSAQWIDAWRGSMDAPLESLTAAIRAHLALIATAHPHPDIRTLDTPTPPPIRHNLPAQTTPFVGRESELAELARLLTDPAIRLLTLLGPGGVGKTRLGLEAARRYGQEYQTWVVYVELVRLSEPADIVTAIADAVGYTFVLDQRPPSQQLLDILRDQSLLLVLDNFEHLLTGAGLVTGILQAAPRVRVLVTSRERLQLSGEQLFQLGGMEFPDRETLEDAAKYTAVKFFLQSAKRVRVDYELRSENMTYVASICRLVEGLPLGILLAAGWLDMLSTKEVAEEIEGGLDFLETEMRDLPERQRSIRAIFDYSWRLLNEEQQTAFMKLSVFRGGMMRQAAQEVTGVSLRALTALSNKSLINRTSKGRYDIHELLRQYGEDQLDQSGQSHSVRDAHSKNYLNLVHHKEAYIKGRDQVAGLKELDADFENIRVAWRWAVARRDYEAIDRTIEGFYWFCSIRRRIQDGQALFDLGQAALSPSEDIMDREPMRVWARLRVRHLTERHFPVLFTPEIVTRIESSLAIARRNEDQGEMAFCLWSLGMTYRGLVTDPSRVDEFQRKALAYFGESLDYYRTSGEEFYQAEILRHISSCYRALGQTKKACQVLEESLILRRSIGDLDGTAKILPIKNYWCVEWVRGNRRQLEALTTERLSIEEKLGDKEGMAFGYINRGIRLLIFDGDLDRAQEAAKAAKGLTRETIISSMIGRLNWFLGMIAIFQGDYVKGEMLLQQALQRVDVTDRTNVLIFLAMAYCGLGDYTQAKKYVHKSYLSPVDLWEGLARTSTTAIVLAAERERVLAVELLSLASNHPFNDGRAVWPQLKQLRTELAAQLDPDTFSSAWERGIALAMDETIDRLRQEIEWLSAPMVEPDVESLLQ